MLLELALHAVVREVGLKPFPVKVVRRVAVQDFGCSEWQIFFSSEWLTFCSFNSLTFRPFLLTFRPFSPLNFCPFERQNFHCADGWWTFCCSDHPGSRRRWVEVAVL